MDCKDGAWEPTFRRQAASTSTKAGVVVSASDELVWTVETIGAMGSGEFYAAADLVCEHVQAPRWLGNIATLRVLRVAIWAPHDELSSRPCRSTASPKSLPRHTFDAQPDPTRWLDKCAADASTSATSANESATRCRCWLAGAMRVGGSCSHAACAAAQFELRQSMPRIERAFLMLESAMLCECCCFVYIPCLVVSTCWVLSHSQTDVLSAG